MLKPLASIKKPADITEVFKRGKRVFESALSLTYLPSPKREVLVIVSRKQGGAVKRNRTRRLIKEFFRLNEQEIKSGKFVVVPRAPLLKNYEEVSKIMLRLLKKIGH